MPWKECHVMDERLRFVARLLEGEKMTALCAEFGISRKTGYKIYDRYQDCGVVGLSDRGRLSETAHRSIDSCQHNQCVECSHQQPQLRAPHAYRLHNSSVEAAVVKTSKGARRWERSSGSIAEPAGICGHNQQ
jgi:transposase